jgi:ubiquinone/menaquinone biosynthesis C-methylase UbiE
MTTTPEDSKSDYVPALRFRALTRFYDRLINATMKEDKFRRLLLAQANVQPGHRVLDIGCGTGTFKPPRSSCSRRDGECRPGRW